MANDMANNTRDASTQLGEVSDAGAGLVLERIRDQLGPSMWCCGTAPAWPSASAGESLLDLSPSAPAPKCCAACVVASAP